MEPDISATSITPVTGGAGPKGSDEDLLAMLAADAVATRRAAAHPAVTEAPANGNGHSNGHANGNGHAHASVRWGALAGPVSVTTALGSYATTVPVRTPDEGIYLRAGKRFFDVVGALAAMIVTGPLMIAAALAIKIESPGPVLYKSKRIGRNGRPFTFIKLRSMVDGADRNRHHLTHLNECDGPVFKMSNDPRVTRVGRFLRTTSIDELPQFWNVLRGDMSLVGPRPPIPEEVAHYQPWQMRRFDVRPGLTCLWQISGRSNIGFEEWMRLDLEYIRCQSARMDLEILVRTIPAVLSREGAY